MKSDIAEAIKNLSRTLERRVIKARWGKGGMDEDEKREVAATMDDFVKILRGLGLSEKEGV